MRFAKFLHSLIHWSLMWWITGLLMDWYIESLKRKRWPLVHWLYWLLDSLIHIGWLTCCTVDSLIRWFTDSSIQWLIDSLNRWTIHLLPHWLIQSLHHWFHWFLDWGISWFMDSSIQWFIDLLTWVIGEWLTNGSLVPWIFELLSDWFIDAVVHWFSHSLVHWFTESFIHSIRTIYSCQFISCHRVFPFLQTSSHRFPAHKQLP